MKSKLYLPALAVVAALSAGSVGIYAAQSTENDALAVSSASITLSQAIAVAEQHVGGKAARAEYESEKGKAVFDVEVVKDNTVTDVKVDPTSGKVISAKADTADHDNDQGGDQDDAD